MEGEFYNFIEVWSLIFISLSYCYTIGRIIPKGIKRFIFILPIVFLFLLLPLKLFSPHFGGLTSFFVAWLANFKLLLYSFGNGPLSSNSSISFSYFILIACFPIKIQQNSAKKSHVNDQNEIIKRHKSIQSYVIKALLLSTLVIIFSFDQSFHPKILMILLCFHMYFSLELVLALLAVISKALLGFELEPQFNEPYLATSLQDFWGKRWNLMVSSILRSTIYEPLIKTFSPIIGQKWASLLSIMGTFSVSAIMHELIFYYLGRIKPSWEISLFFMLHGICLVIEVALKKVFDGKWKLPRLISTPLTIGFVMATSFWLFFPHLFRCKVHVKAFEEYAALSKFVRDASGSFKLL